MSSVADFAGWCSCKNSSSAWFTRQRPRSASVTAGMNAFPATALGEFGSWNRSNQPDSADGEGVARSRSRRQRLFSDRRSARDSKSFSIARRIAEKPPSRSNRSMSSTQSPPARFRKITARTIWMSSQPWPPAARTCRRIAAPRPLALIRSKYKGRPPKEVRPWLDGSASYWKSSSPCATIAHPVGDGFRIAIQDYLPDESGPTGNLNFLDAESRVRRQTLCTADPAMDRCADPFPAVDGLHDRAVSAHFGTHRTAELGLRSGAISLHFRRVPSLRQ